MRTSKGSAMASKETVHLWIKMVILVSTFDLCNKVSY